MCNVSGQHQYCNISDSVPQLDPWITMLTSAVTIANKTLELTIIYQHNGSDKICEGHTNQNYIIISL